jgi:hypothetical protein
LHATKQAATDALNDEKIISRPHCEELIKTPGLVPGVLFLMFVKRPA